MPDNWWDAPEIRSHLSPVETAPAAAPAQADPAEWWKSPAIASHLTPVDATVADEKAPAKAVEAQAAPVEAAGAARGGGLTPLGRGLNVVADAMGTMLGMPQSLNDQIIQPFLPHEPVVLPPAPPPPVDPYKSPLTVGGFDLVTSPAQINAMAAADVQRQQAEHDAEVARIADKLQQIPGMSNSGGRAVETASAMAGSSVVAAFDRVFGEKGSADEVNRRSKLYQEAQLELQRRTGAWSPYAENMMTGAMRSLLETESVPGGAYSKAIGTAIYVANQSYTEAIDKEVNKPGAVTYAVAQGLIEGGVASVMNRLGMGGLESVRIGEKIAGSTLKDVAEAYIKTTGHEITEEVITNVSQKIVSTIAGIDEEGWSPAAVVALVRDTAIQTALTMGMAEAPGAIRTVVGNRNSNPTTPGTTTPTPAPTAPVSSPEEVSARTNRQEAQRSAVGEMFLGDPDKFDRLAALTNPSRKDFLELGLNAKNAEERAALIEHANEILKGVYPELEQTMAEFSALKAEIADGRAGQDDIVGFGEQLDMLPLHALRHFGRQFDIDVSGTTKEQVASKIRADLTAHAHDAKAASEDFSNVTEVKGPKKHLLEVAKVENVNPDELQQRMEWLWNREKETRANDAPLRGLIRENPWLVNYFRNSGKDEASIVGADELFGDFLNKHPEYGNIDSLKGLLAKGVEPMPGKFSRELAIEAAKQIKEEQAAEATSFNFGANATEPAPGPESFNEPVAPTTPAPEGSRPTEARQAEVDARIAHWRGEFVRIVEMLGTDPHNEKLNQRREAIERQLENATRERSNLTPLVAGPNEGKSLLRGGLDLLAGSPSGETLSDSATGDSNAAVGQPHGPPTPPQFDDRVNTVGPAPAAPLNTTAQPAAPPELFQLAKEIFPNGPGVEATSKLRTARGDFNPGTGGVRISRSIAADHHQVARTMAHEIGHLVDWLPDKPLKMDRGNLVGRVHSLRNHLKDTFGANGPSDRVIRQELVAMSQWWRRWTDQGLSQNQRAYFHSGVELYADALSTILNNPAEAFRRAPRFYEAFLENLNTKPDVKQHLVYLYDLLNGTPADLAARRSKTLSDMFEHGDEAITVARELRRSRNSDIFGGLKQALEQTMLDQTLPGKRLAQKVGETRVEHTLDEWFYADNNFALLADKMNQEAYRPMIDAGLTRDDMGEYLLMKRIVNERGEILNPLAFQPEQSQQQLDALQQRLGPQKYAVLEQGMQKFHDLVFGKVREAMAEGIVSQKLFSETIEPNKDSYAAFAVVKYLEDYVPATIRKQVGTFEEIANPFDATMMKVLSLTRLTELQRAKRAVIDMMNSHFASDIKKVDIPHGQRAPAERAAYGKDHLLMLEDGKLAAYEVDLHLAKMFNSHDLGGMVRAGRIIRSGVYQLWHPLFVTYNPGFLAANLFRDIRRTHKLLGSIGTAHYGRMVKDLMAQGFTREQAKAQAKLQKINIFQMLQAVWRARPESQQRASGNNSPKVQQMMADKALATPFVSLTQDTIQSKSEFERQLAEHGLGDVQAARKGVMGTLDKFLGALKWIGETQETMTKIAAWDLLEKRGVTGAERAHIVRNYVGTPNFKQKGLANPLTNSIWMYGKIRLTGLRSEADIAFSKETAAGYWARQLQWSVIPAVLTSAALHGLFGDWWKEAFKGLPDYFLQTYDMIPFWHDDGEVWSLSIPMDDASRMIRYVVMASIDGLLAEEQKQAKGKNPEQVAHDFFRRMLGELAPNENPALNILSTWGSYVVGQNPVDTHYGKPVVGDREWKAGGWYSFKAMAAWTARQFGAVSDLSHAAITVASGEPMTKGTILRNIPGLNRLVRMSDQGHTEEFWNTVENDDREKARFSLGLPPSTHKLTTERFVLARQEPTSLTATENARREALSNWYLRVYLPTTKAMKEARDAGLDDDFQAGFGKLEETGKLLLDKHAKVAPELVSPSVHQITDKSFPTISKPTTADRKNTSEWALIQQQGVDLKTAQRMLDVEARLELQHREDSAAAATGRKARTMGLIMTDALLHRKRILRELYTAP